MKKGFIFIETIIVVTILTVALMSIYANYSKIISNTKEFNTFDTAEYNYKTYYLKEVFFSGRMKQTSDAVISSTTRDECYMVQTPFSDGTKHQVIGTIEDKYKYGDVKVCILKDVSTSSVDTYIKNNLNKLDAYIIDYLLNQDFNQNNDSLFLVEYKRKDILNFSSGNEEYLTYISSLNF